MENQINWKRKLSLFLELLVDTILEAIHVAVYILLTYLMSLLVKYTIGEINKDWAEFANKIPHGALLVVSIIGAFQLVATTAFRTYHKLKKEARDDDENDNRNG
jgi:uncharacterized membrane protein YkvI